MNKNQKIILGIFIPIIVFFIAWAIASSVGFTVKNVGLEFGWETSHYVRRPDPFDWQRTWHVWMGYFIFCCIFEYKLFADKKNKK